MLRRYVSTVNIGVAFDPDDLVARWQSGADVTDMVLRSDQDRIAVAGSTRAS